MIWLTFYLDFWPGVVRLITGVNYTFLHEQKQLYALFVRNACTLTNFCKSSVMIILRSRHPVNVCPFICLLTFYIFEMIPQNHWADLIKYDLKHSYGHFQGFQTCSDKGLFLWDTSNWKKEYSMGVIEDNFKKS